MSYPYKYTFPENLSSVGYNGPMPIEIKQDTFVNGLIDSPDGKALIRAAIQRILLTNTGERVMQPEFGTKLRAMLFEPLDNQLLLDIKEILGIKLEKHEPRIRLLDVDFEPDYDNHTITISLSYEYLQNGEKDILSFLLK